MGADVSLFDLTLLPAGQGDSILLEYGDPAAPHRMLVGGGPARCYDGLAARLAELPADRRRIELLVLTHVDADHIEGVLNLVNDARPAMETGELWFNGYEQLPPDDVLGSPQGEILGRGCRHSTGPLPVPLSRGRLSCARRRTALEPPESTALKSREGFVPGIQRPSRRPLKIYAFDPGLRRIPGNITVVDVVNEPLTPGPVGRLVRVIDYDAGAGSYYAPVDLDDPAVLVQRGLDPSDSDPRFHQQMVYAVTMKVIENFERALGRPLRFRGNRQLTVLPHAFEGENAFYDPDTLSVHYGYFAADRVDPGPNLPGQTVFTCLSHDIVAHETTHAVIDRLRDRFNDPTNRDVLAFHEGLADVVAIFQHFTFPDVLRHEIKITRSELNRPNRLLELAQQFGYATGSGQALRTATELDDHKPDPRLYDEVLEAHDRGSILVAAVFDAFFQIYRNRMTDLLRAATGGSGILPQGELQADLLSLTAREASAAAQDVLTMCLRAFEYLPPVDVTFGDYLRAVVTADFELNPRDEFQRRASFIDAFRTRGIYAPAVASLAEEALKLSRPPDLDHATIPPDLVTEVLASQFAIYDSDKREERARVIPSKKWFAVLQQFAARNAAHLQLDPDEELAVQVVGIHPSFHADENGQLLVELVAQWTQTPPKGHPKRVEEGGIHLRAGTTAVFGADGRVRYVAARPLPGTHLADNETQQEAAEGRVAGFHAYVAALDATDPLPAWIKGGYENRMVQRARFAAAHRNRPPRRNGHA